MNLIAFKTYADIEESKRPKAVPLGAVYYFNEIKESQKSDFELFGHKVMTKQEYASYVQSISESYEYWYENFANPKSIDRLRVLDFVQDDFKYFHPSKIDFRRHLKTDVSLQKTVVMGMNGRPIEAIYTLDGIKIAKISFSFQVDAFNFMTKRTETLGYYTVSDEIKKSFKIWEQDYNSDDPHHQTERIAERVEARTIIMNQIKSVLDRAVAAFYLSQGKTYSEILLIAGEFYQSYNNDIQMFINTGSPALRLRVTNEPLEGVMGIVIPGSEQTVKDFLIERLSY